MKRLSLRNIGNGLLLLLVSIPSIFLSYYVIMKDCEALSPNLYFLCRMGYEKPILFVNSLFFFNVCVLFWIISLIQNSTWLIDPYWTIIPPMIGLFYHFHPLSHGNPYRSYSSLILVFIWSIRLTHSYFRRENYLFGEKEDWRFTDMKIKNPKNWWWISFFAAFLSQQPMLVGITLPLWAINLHRQSYDNNTLNLNTLDIFGLIGCVLGISMAYIADNQLRKFMILNEELEKNGKSKVLLLNTGLWKYSRHPNYFGEQLWWWSLSLLACSVGEYWTIIGTLFNSLIMIQVTILTENRIMQNKKRQLLYQEYKETTSVWIPWFRFKTKKS